MILTSGKKTSKTATLKEINIISLFRKKGDKSTTAVLEKEPCDTVM